MVFPIIGPRGIQGAHVTFLSRDGATKANIETPRRMYGKAKGGYVILGVLEGPDQPQVRGEGIETVLSASQISGYPGIAALSANNLPFIDPPPCNEIIVAGDNDRPGLQAAEKAVEQWWRHDIVIRRAIPTDWNDWCDVLGDLRSGELGSWRQSIRQAEAVEFAPPIGALGIEDFMRLKFPPRKFLLNPWLTTTGLVMIDAMPGHGKTWLALSIGYAVASGNALLGWQNERRGNVLYVDGELPGALLQTRFDMFGAPPPASAFRILSRAQFERRSQSMLDLGTPEGREKLDDIIEANHIDLIILDSISTLVRSGIDNDVESWRAVQDWSLKHRARGRAVIFLHHQGRSGNPRGTSSREIVLDTRIKLTLDEKLSTDETTAFKLEFPKAREFYGTSAAPMMIHLSTKSGVVQWSYEAVRESNRERVKELKSQGWKASEIAKELGVTKGRVSQIMKELSLSRRQQPETDPARADDEDDELEDSANINGKI